MLARFRSIAAFVCGLALASAASVVTASPGVIRPNGGGGSSSIDTATVLSAQALYDRHVPWVARTPGGNVVVDPGAYWPTPAFVTSATNASPIVITTNGQHGYQTGQSVRIKNVTTNTAANGTFTITVLTSTTFSLNGSTGNGAYSGAAGSNLDTDPVVHPLLSMNFVWEAWVKPDATNQGYWLSDSGGGGHALLVGFQGSVPGSPVDGNIWGAIGAGVGFGESFGGHSAIGPDEWAHVMVACDGTYVRVFVDGVMTGRKLLTLTERFALTTALGGHPLIGGPLDHQTWIGSVSGVRAFDAFTSVTAKPNYIDPTGNKLELAFRPERIFSPGVGDLSNTYLSADYVWNAATATYLDGSDNGRNGVRHNGTPKNVDATTSALSGRSLRASSPYDTQMSFVRDPYAPNTREPFAQLVGATNATPVVAQFDRDVCAELATGDVVVIDSAVGNTGANGTYAVTKVDCTHWTLVSSAGTGTWTSGGNVNHGAKEVARTPLATPTGAIAWDSFQRRNQTYAFQPAGIISLGKTEAGSAGIKTWTNFRNPFFNGGVIPTTIAPFGILDGAVVFLGDGGGYGEWIDTGVSDNYRLVIEGETGTYGLGSAALAFRGCDQNNFRLAIWDREAGNLIVAQVSGGSYVGPDAGATSVTSIAAISGSDYEVVVHGTTFDFYVGTSQSSLLAGGGTLVRTHTSQTSDQTCTKVGIYHEADNSKFSSLWRYKKFGQVVYP